MDFHDSIIIVMIVMHYTSVFCYTIICTDVVSAEGSESHVFTVV